VLQPEAYEGMKSAFEYRVEESSPETAREWAVGLMEAVNSPRHLPTRCRIAPDREVFPYEVRQLLYTMGRSTYRVLFTITEDVVHILHIRHSAQDSLKREARHRDP
jgi:hypothetical protein